MFALIAKPTSSLTAKDQKELQKMVSRGVQQVRVVLRALALLQLAKSVAAPRVAGMNPLTAQAIRNVGRRYQEGGLERALCEKQRPGAAEVLGDSQKQRLLAMVCTESDYLAKLDNPKVSHALRRPPAEAGRSLCCLVRPELNLAQCHQLHVNKTPLGATLISGTSRLVELPGRAGS